MTLVARPTVEQIVAECVPHSDCPVEVLEQYARLFVKVMLRNPQGNVLEIGTRDGGSAKLWLDLLAHLDSLRFVMTVDPYGLKPYEGVPMYGHYTYVSAKQLLSPYANHAHFLGTSFSFFDRMTGWCYWDAEEYPLAPLAFAFLDGDHSWEVVRTEVDTLAHGWMTSRGAILVDNAYEPFHPDRPTNHVEKFINLGYEVERIGETGAVIWIRK